MPVDISGIVPPQWNPTGAVRTNLCTNPGFGVDTAGWAGDAAALATSTAQAHDGAQSLLVTPSVAGGGATYDVTATAGVPYTVSAWFYSPAARTAQIFISGTGGSGVISLPAGVWTRISVTATPASSGVKTIYFSSQSTTGIFYIDSVLIEAEPDLVPAYDGDTTDDPGPGFAHLWTGAQGASTSTRTALVETPGNLSDFLHPVRVPQPVGEWETHRHTEIVYELLGIERDADGNIVSREVPLGLLTGAKESEGTLTWDATARIKGGGSIEVADDGQDVDWVHARVRIWRLMNDVVQPRGIWIPTFPDAKWLGGNRYWTIELHDKLVLLDQDSIQEGVWYGPEPGEASVTDVLATVKELIESTGESAEAIVLVEPPILLTHEMFFEAGTPKLTIINALLDASGYFTLRTNDEGQYIANPYVKPHQRGPIYDFVDGYNCVYKDEFSVHSDTFFVPNKVVAISPGDDQTEALVAVAENRNDLSPYSFFNMGNKWIVDVQTGVEAVDQAALDDYAYARLVRLSNPGASIDIQIAPLPVDIYETVVFRYTAAETDDFLRSPNLYVIDKMNDSLSETGLMTLTIRAVASYDEEPDPEGGGE